MAFTENPLTRFDEDVKLARAYDQWVSLYLQVFKLNPTCLTTGTRGTFLAQMLNHMRTGFRDLVLRLYFRLFVADLARTLQEGQFVGSRLVMLDLLLAVYTICVMAYICLFGITATTSTVYRVLGR